MTDPAAPRLFRRLQALEDAIAFRRARLAYPCPDCRDGARCDDHACDLALLAGYADDVRAASEAIRPDGEAICGTRRGRVPGARRAQVKLTELAADRYPPASRSISTRDLR